MGYDTEKWFNKKVFLGHAEYLLNFAWKRFQLF